MQDDRILKRLKLYAWFQHVIFSWIYANIVNISYVLSNEALKRMPGLKKQVIASQKIEPA